MENLTLVAIVSMSTVCGIMSWQPRWMTSNCAGSMRNEGDFDNFLKTMVKNGYGKVENVYSRELNVPSQRSDMVAV